MKYRNSGANEEHIIQNRFTAYLLVALQRRKVDFLLRRYSHQQHEQPVEAINTAYASICQTLDLQTEYAALMRLLVTLPERERTILLSRAMENRSFAELADKYHMGYKGVAAIYYRTIQRIRKELEEK